MTSQQIAITSTQLRAEVSEQGAELRVLQDGDGNDLLWNGDPAYWTGRAPLLFPMVGRAKNDQIRVNGQVYNLPRHGFARNSRFAVVEQSCSSCTLRLSSSPDTLAHYPFGFELDVTYGVAGSVLNHRAVVRNPGDKPLPVSFGFHPAFRWPLPFGGAREDHEIRFEQEENVPIRRVQDGLLTPMEHPTPVENGRLGLRDTLFEDDALILLSHASRSVTYGVPGHPLLQVRFPGIPHLGIWSKPGAGFVCIEPWQGFASPETFDGEFADRPGVIVAPANGEIAFTMEVAIVPEQR